MSKLLHVAFVMVKLDFVQVVYKPLVQIVALAGLIWLYKSVVLFI